jgi:hypothetical protein
MSEITASPLSWPPQHPRTPNAQKTYGRFGQKNGYGVKILTVAQGTRRVMEQIESYTQAGHKYRIDPCDVIISSNLALRANGLPRSGQKTPTDTGVAVYFTLDKKERCIPCDKYFRAADNLAAIAATLNALRTIERHGVKHV